MIEVMRLAAMSGHHLRADLHRVDSARGPGRRRVRVGLEDVPVVDVAGRQGVRRPVAARCTGVEAIDERAVVDALQRLDPLWDQLFPAEQTRITQLLVERVIVRLDGLEIRLRVEGIGSVVDDLRRGEPERTAA